MQVETFIFRMKALDTDFSTYVGNMIIMILKNIYIFNLNETLDPHKSSAEFCIIVFLSILYADYILEEPVHPEGAEFPESQKVLKKEESYYCPAKEGNLENPMHFVDYAWQNN